MKITVLSFLFLSLSLGLMAQPAGVRTELEQAFAEYQKAFNKANQSLKTVVEGVKNASSVKDAQHYASMASKLATAAKIHSESARDRAKKALVASECDKGKVKLEAMSTGFDGAKGDFLTSEDVLTAASLEGKLDDISEKLIKAVEVLQAGVLKLNESVKNMNSAITEMKGCGS